MSINSILEYQELDKKLFKIEKGLRENPNKKKANQMHDNMKNAQSKSFKLEEKAGELLAEIDKVKKQFQIQQNKMNEFMEKDLEKLSIEEIDKLNTLKNKLSQNLVILEKNLTALAENVNIVLSEFNKTIKVFNASKDNFANAKKMYDKDVELVEKDKNEIENKLKELSKKVTPKVFEEYQKRRKENIFPVVVPLHDNCCGGCNMVLPYANLSKLENDGILICEHCHRIIYKA